MPVRIVADSTCSPSAEKVKTLGITIVPINIHFGNQVYKDFFELSPDEFYVKLAAASELPTTSAPSADRFYEAFKKILNGGDSVLCLTVTSGLSNTYNVALAARSRFSKEEAAQIHVFDTRAAGASASLLAVAAAELAAEDMGMEKIESHLAALVPNARLLVMFDTLKYIEKSGRVGKIAAVAGDLFNVKPVICMHAGTTSFFGRARGKAQAVKLILDEFKRDTAGARDVRVSATHANAAENLPPLVEGVRAVFPDIGIDTVPFTPAMGAHAGPGIIGIGYTCLKD
jgi:DegV family protein with EDD domain